MQCPVCKQRASSLPRYALSLQGVSLRQSLLGLLKCEHCGALLRTVRYSNNLWFAAMAGLALLTIVVALFSVERLRSLGNLVVLLYWVLLVIIVIGIYVYGIWKAAILEQVTDVQEAKPTIS